MDIRYEDGFVSATSTNLAEVERTNNVKSFVR